MEKELLTILDDILKLGGRALSFTNTTKLLGALPELDSLAVTTLLTQLEQHFSIRIEDDEFDGSIFRTVGSLSEFLQQKIGATRG